MLLLAWVFSTNRRAIRWRTVIWGLSLQIVFAFLVLEWTVGQRVLAIVGAAITHMLNYSFAGSQMVFGELGKQHSSFGMVFAFQVLPTIIFISALFAVLYHIGIMQLVIRFFARLMLWTMPSVAGICVSGTSILEMRMVPGAVMMTAASRCSASIPYRI